MLRSITRRSFVQAAAVGCALAAIPAVARAASFAGGAGTAENPWQIADANQLAGIAQDLTASYALVADIDLTGMPWQPLGALTYSADVDMQTGGMDLTRAFSGIFDGCGHTLSGLSYTADADQLAAGFIACSTGEVRNLVIEGFSVDGGETASATGAVVGYLMAGVVENVTCRSCEASGTNCTGIVVGGSMAPVRDCIVEDCTVTVLGSNDFTGKDLIQCDVAECGGLVVGGAFMGSLDNCTAQGTVRATGNEPVGMGGVAGCIQCVPSISGNRAQVVIECGNGHAIGGLCGYAGVGDDGDGTVDEPCIISDCSVEIAIKADGATHVGGLVGTGLYFYGMEDRFLIRDCSVQGTIDGAENPGCVAGRAVGSTIESCEFDVLVDGEEGADEVGRTKQRYESADQYEDGTPQAVVRLFTTVGGTYTPLFERIITDDTYQLWYDDCAAVLGSEDGAEEAVEMLQNSVTSTLTGEEAVEAYADEPEAAGFYCGFGHDIAELTFEGNTLTGRTEDGEEVFSHSYEFDSYDEQWGCYIYKADVEDAGEFAYVMLLPDTPAHTFHIEMRYGSDPTAITNWQEGAYAYWMASGILANADDYLVDNVIELFCIENLEA